MGTRNITAVIHDGKIKISQYGQWDGYYDYTGREVLKFCRKYLSIECNREKFTERVNLCKQVSKSFRKIMDTVDKKMGRENNKKFCVPFNQLFPQMSRDTGFKILNIIWELQPYDFNTDDENNLTQHYPIHLCLDCGYDNIFGIEYTNVIDLDNNMVYMLTSHTFKGEALDTTDLIDKTYIGQYCYLKYSLHNIPDEETVDHQVEMLFTK